MSDTQGQSKKGGEMRNGTFTLLAYLFCTLVALGSYIWGLWHHDTFYIAVAIFIWIIKTEAPHGKE